MRHHRFDRTLTVIIWSDLALSLATVVAAVAVVPVLMAVGAPAAAPATTIALLVDAALLGGFGGVGAVLLMIRLHHGDASLPAGLRLPLPRFMRPELGRPAGRESVAAGQG